MAQVPEKLWADTAAASLTGSPLKVWTATEIQRTAEKKPITLEHVLDALRVTYGQLFPEQNIRQQLMSLTRAGTVKNYARVFTGKWPGCRRTQ